MSSENAFDISSEVSSREELFAEEVPLLVFRVIGCTVVTLLVGFTIIIYVTSGMFHIDCLAQISCECCIFVAYMLILLTTTEPYRINVGMCLTIAIFLHFLFVAAAFFLLLETLCMSQARFGLCRGMQLSIKSLFIVGWVCPAVTTGVSAIIWSKEYTTRNNCWLDTSQSPYWPTMIPIVCCICLQAFLILISLCMSESTASLTDSQYRRARCYRTTRWASLIIALMLNLSWFFGVSAYHTGREDFYGAFTVASILLGVCIFILRISTDDEMREKIIKNVLCCIVDKNRVISFNDGNVFNNNYADKLVGSMRNVKVMEGQNGTIVRHK